MLYNLDHDTTRYDATMRSRTMREPGLAAPVAKVGKFRLKFIHQLFREMGFIGQQLLTRSHLCLAYMSSQRIILDGLLLQQRRRQLKLALALLTAKTGDQVGLLHTTGTLAALNRQQPCESVHLRNPYPLIRKPSLFHLTISNSMLQSALVRVNKYFFTTFTNNLAKTPNYKLSSQ